MPTNLLKLAEKALELTKSAIQAAHNDDWETSQSLIQQRTQQLEKLPTTFSSLSHEKQLELREILESVDKHNSDFLQFANANKAQLMQIKADMTKNKNAINHYLDHAEK